MVRRESGVRPGIGGLIRPSRCPTPRTTREEIEMAGNGGQGSKWIRRERRLAIYLRDRFECAYCGRDLRDARRDEVTLDHLIPRSEFGTNDTTNLVTACHACNVTRQDRPWREFATGGAVQRIEWLVTQPINRDLARAILAGHTPMVEAMR